MSASLPASSSSTSTAATECPAIAAPLAQVLGELRDLLAVLPADQYTSPAGRYFANSTIGGHVRHCLDHASALVDGSRTGTVDYDHRARGTCIETDLSAAEAELVRLIASVARLASSGANDPIEVSVIPKRDGTSVTLGSTLGREIAFVLSHTIHHNATIRGIVLSFGREVPASFGYAPSTLAHQDGVGGTRCAP